MENAKRGDIPQDLIVPADAIDLNFSTAGHKAPESRFRQQPKHEFRRPMPYSVPKGKVNHEKSVCAGDFICDSAGGSPPSRPRAGVFQPRFNGMCSDRMNEEFRQPKRISGLDRLKPGTAKSRLRCRDIAGSRRPAHRVQDQWVCECLWGRV
jgi:hypothetical protein